MTWRICPHQYACDFGTCIPAWQHFPFAQIIFTDFRSRNCQRFFTCRNFIDLFITIFIRQVYKFPECNAFNSDFVLMLCSQFLSGIRMIEGLALRILSGTGVIAADDEVICSVIPPNDHVPERFTWASHPHRKRKNGHHRIGVIKMLFHQCPYAADPRIVIDITRTRDTGCGMNQQSALNNFAGASRCCFMASVHRIPSLKCDNIFMMHCCQSLPDLSGRKTERLKIMVPWQRYYLQRSGDILRTPLTHFPDEWMPRVGRTQDAGSLLTAVITVYFFDRHYRQHFILRTAKGDPLVQFQSGKMLQWKGNWNGEKCPVGKPHLLHDSVVIRFSDKPVQRRKRPRREQFQVANRPRRDLY